MRNLFKVETDGDDVDDVADAADVGAGALDCGTGGWCHSDLKIEK